MLSLRAEAGFERVHTELLRRTEARAALRYPEWVLLITSHLQKVRLSY
jgi:hypothetical protein